MIRIQRSDVLASPAQLHCGCLAIRPHLCPFAASHNQMTLFCQNSAFLGFGKILHNKPLVCLMTETKKIIKLSQRYSALEGPPDHLSSLSVL